MNFVLSVIAKTTIMLACASLMTLALRRASASARHAVWAIALLGALILPFAAWILPEVSLPVLPVDGLTSDEPVPFSQSIGPIPHVPAPRISGLVQVPPAPSSSSTAFHPPAERASSRLQGLIKAHP